MFEFLRFQVVGIKHKNHEIKIYTSMRFLGIMIHHLLSHLIQ